METGDAAKHPIMQTVSSQQQRIILPQVLMVPKLRNPDRQIRVLPFRVEERAFVPLKHRAYEGVVVPRKRAHYNPAPLAKLLTPQKGWSPDPSERVAKSCGFDNY